MSEQWRETKPNCYIEFRITDKERFAAFTHFFKALKQWTETLEPGSYTDDTHVSRAPTNPADDTQEITVRADETLSRRDFARPEDWMLAFRPSDLKLLGMPDHAQAINTLKDWQGLTRRERRKFIKGSNNQNQLQTLADFADMIRYWHDVEYTLISCTKEFDLGRVEYSTYDFPFNGKVALEELLMFFGFFSVVHDSC